MQKNTKHTINITHLILKTAPDVERQIILHITLQLRKLSLSKVKWLIHGHTISKYRAQNQYQILQMSSLLYFLPLIFCWESCYHSNVKVLYLQKVTFSEWYNLKVVKRHKPALTLGPSYSKYDPLTDSISLLERLKFIILERQILLLYPRPTAFQFSSVQFSSVAQWCPILCDLMD